MADASPGSKPTQVVDGLEVLSVATADWHVPERAGAGAWASVPEVRGDAVWGLTAATQLAVRYDVDLLAAGDLFDGPWPEPAAVEAVQRVLYRAWGSPEYDDRPELLYVLGNHERGHDWLPMVRPGAVLLDGRPTLLRRQSRHDIPWGVAFGVSCVGTAKEFKDAAARAYDAALAAASGVPGVRTVGLFHQHWSDFTAGAGRGGFSLSLLPPCDLAVCGDVHVHTARVAPAGAAGPKLVVSPGALAPQSVAELAPGRAFLVTRTADDGLGVNTVELPSRPVTRAAVESSDDAERVLAGIASAAHGAGLPAHVARPLFVVDLAADLVGFVDAARAAAEKSGAIVSVRQAGPPARPRPAAWAPKADLAAAVRGRPGVSPAAADLCDELLYSVEDPKRAVVAAAERTTPSARIGTPG
jgi:hypothetical protein